MPRHADIAIPTAGPYVLRRARVPACFLRQPLAGQQVDPEGSVLLDIRIEGEKVASLSLAGTRSGDGTCTIPVAIAGDNCRDAWFPFGDHDMVDTVQQSVRVFQFDNPIAQAVEMAGPIASAIVELPEIGVDRRRRCRALHPVQRAHAQRADVSAAGRSHRHRPRPARHPVAAGLPGVDALQRVVRIPNQPAGSRMKHRNALTRQAVPASTHRPAQPGCQGALFSGVLQK